MLANERILPRLYARSRRLSSGEGAGCGGCGRVRRKAFGARCAVRGGGAGLQPVARGNLV